MIHLLSIGQQWPQWAQEAFDNYAKRLQGNWQCKLQTFSNHNSSSIEHNKKCEGKKLVAAIPSAKNKMVIALDRTGEHHDSIGFARLMNDCHHRAEKIIFIIGGPDGLSDEVLNACNRKLSLSSLTFPHAFARVIMIEQIYRAWTIHHNHPYHK